MVVPARLRLIRVRVKQRDHDPGSRVLKDCLPENSCAWGDDWLSAGLRQVY